MSQEKKSYLRYIYVAGLIVVAVYLLFNGDGVFKYLSLKAELKELQKEITEAEEKVSKLELEIDSLKNSKEKIEQAAREKYHMLKPDERVIQVEEKD